MSHHLTTDARYHVHRGCPVDTEVLPADEQVEIVIGAQRGTGEVVRLVMSDTDTCFRIANAFIQAGNLAIAVIERANRSAPGPAMSQVDTSETFDVFRATA